jgi:hypothetical protein
MEYTTNLNLKKPGYSDTADIADINDNMDTLDTAVYGKKTKQSAVSDPTASGTANAFISKITQNANGVISAEKKTVAVSNAGVTLAWGTSKTIGSVAGTNLTATLPSNPVTKSNVDSALGAGSGSTFYKKDGTWANPVSKSAVDSALGAGSGSTFYRKDGSWATPSVTKSQVDSALGAGSGSTFYKKDGTWATPTDDIAIIREYTCIGATISAGGTKSFLANELDYEGTSMAAPSGYKAAAVIYVTPGDSSCTVDLVNAAASGSETAVRVRNTASSSKSSVPKLKVLYLKTNLF